MAKATKGKKGAKGPTRPTATALEKFPAEVVFQLAPTAGAPCSLPKVCAYLKLLHDWTKKVEAYELVLANAICNVEKQAFIGGGSTARPPRLCLHTGGSEPEKPPSPPDW